MVWQFQLLLRSTLLPPKSRLFVPARNDKSRLEGSTLQFHWDLLLQRLSGVRQGILEVQDKQIWAAQI